MGTDIHYEFQKLNKEGEWEEIKVDTSYKGEYYIPRHYLLFSILAGVRNGFGFASTKTYNPVKPISKPKGLPQDINDSLHYDDYNPYGDHSFSWLSDKEILDYFEKHKNKNTSFMGVIPKEDFIKWDLKTPPESFSGDVLGNSIFVNYLPYDFQKAQEDLKKGSSEYTHYQINWVSNILNEVTYFKDMICKLKSTYGEIRIVFGFDS